MRNFIIGEVFSDILSHYASVLLTLTMHETRLHWFVHTLSVFTSSYTELQHICCVIIMAGSLLIFSNRKRFLLIVAVQKRYSHEFTVSKYLPFNQVMPIMCFYHFTIYTIVD